MRAMTKANLEAAFSGESQAHMKYAIFADKAEKEGYPEVARLFRAISYAERVHATNHLRELGGIGNTAANLETAAAGENYENTEMYPAFDAVAHLQVEKGAVRSIHYALEAEKIHEAMYTEAGESIAAGKDIRSAAVYICPVCGHTVIGEAPDKCPICSLPKDKYREF
ncbi:MAG: rubrerythrin family protein [Fidelibacterota bacterium]|nr:MAG: rubrerythrin family protein [Candidatus Neomarinimicrobiota bacterium]